MAKYTVFESTNMGSTKYAERIFDAVATDDIENGTFGYLNGLADGESVIYKFVKGFKAGEPIVVVDQPEWDEETYGTRHAKMRRDNFIVKAGTPFRVRVIKKLDEFGITAEGITAASRSVVTGTSDFTETKVYLKIDNSTGKLVASTTEPDEVTFIAEIMRKRMIGGTLTTMIRNYGYANAIYEAKVTYLA